MCGYCGDGTNCFSTYVSCHMHMSHACKWGMFQFFYYIYIYGALMNMRVYSFTHKMTTVRVRGSQVKPTLVLACTLSAVTVQMNCVGMVRVKQLPRHILLGEGSLIATLRQVEGHPPVLLLRSKDSSTGATSPGTPLEVARCPTTRTRLPRATTPPRPMLPSSWGMATM